MQLICKETSIKYNGKRYVANVPFNLDVKEIPQELVGIAELYVENVNEEPKQFVSKRRTKVNKEVAKPKATKTSKTKEVKAKEVEPKIETDDLLDSIIL